jgi:hypothetical protein
LLARATKDDNLPTSASKAETTVRPRSVLYCFFPKVLQFIIVVIIAVVVVALGDTFTNI